MRASLHTHYDTLGVGRHATPDEVRTAYRRRAQSCHPDKLPEQAQAQSQMAQINQAYAVLSDPPGRAAYDRWIEAHEALLAAQRAVWNAAHPGIRAAWPWVVLSATIAFSMVTVGTALYKELVPPVVALPATPRVVAGPPSQGAFPAPADASAASNAAPDGSGRRQ